MSHSMTGYAGGLPDNVRNLKSAEVVEFQPSNAQIMTVLIELQAQIASLHSMITANSADIESTKQAINVVVEQVKPTLDMLSNGPIGQLLGIGPKPEPRSRRR
jgi:hypothetical protein